MLRIEREDRIIYIERHRKKSLLFFAVAVACLALTPLVPSTPPSDLRAGLYWFITGCVAVALWYQFQNRAFVIQVARGTLQIMERRFLAVSSRREFPLQGIRVRTSMIECQTFLESLTRIQWIWLDVPGHLRILFEGNIRDQARLRDDVARLIQDLQAPTASQMPTE